MLIAQLSDSHVCLRQDFLGGRVDPIECLRTAVTHLAALQPRPDLVLFSGDLVDSGSADEYRALAELFIDLPIPVRAIPGNHDLGAVLREVLPTWTPAEQGSHASFVDEGFALRIIGLDTTWPGQPSGALDGARLSWLEATLAESKRDTLIFMHHPPVLTGITRMDDCGLLEGREALKSLLERHPQVLGILCGHLHRPIQSSLGRVPVHIAPSVAHQIALMLEPDSPLHYCLEPGRISLHLYVPGRPLVTHSSFCRPFPGPYPF